MVVWLLCVLEFFLTARVDTHTAKCSWYGIECHGRETANQEIYNRKEMTCAHVNAPFGSIIMVQHNGKSIFVRVNDRIPRHYRREIDLSEVAFSRLEDLDVGVIDATVTIWYAPRRELIFFWP